MPSVQNPCSPYLGSPQGQAPPLEGVRPSPQWEERSGWSPAVAGAGRATTTGRHLPASERLRLPPEEGDGTKPVSVSFPTGESKNSQRKVKPETAPRNNAHGKEKTPRKRSGQSPSGPSCLNAPFFQTEPTGLEATNLAKLCLSI